MTEKKEKKVWSFSVILKSHFDTKFVIKLRRYQSVPEALQIFNSGAAATA